MSYFIDVWDKKSKCWDYDYDVKWHFWDKQSKLLAKKSELWPFSSVGRACVPKIWDKVKIMRQKCKILRLKTMIMMWKHIFFW